MLEAWTVSSKPRTPLCKACVSMLGSWSGIRALCSPSGYRHLDIDACRLQADRGCPLCTIILSNGWGKFGMTKREAMTFFARRRDAFALKPDPAWMDVWKDLGACRGLGDIGWLDGGLFRNTELTGNPSRTRDEKPRGRWDDALSLAVLAAPDDPAARYIVERQPTDTFLDDTIMSEAVNWTKDCLEGRHAGCIYAGKPLLPTRVIDVGHPDSPNVHIHASSPHEHEEYVALSYCWGGPQPVVTTIENIAQFSRPNGIVLSDLPQTLQDAVRTTRRLGFRYLWVDALCIIQDSWDDKAVEIDNMGNIYHHATLTIAAASSRSASEGFLRSSTPEYMASLPSCTVPLVENKGTVVLALSSAKPEGHLLEPLRTRAWCFQEAILPQRLAIFSKFELRLHCKARNRRLLNLGSYIGEPDPGELYCTGIRNSFERLEVKKITEGGHWMDISYLHTMWADFLGDFSQRDLTTKDDRLHAVQGVANIIASSGHLRNDMDNRYLAGTWIACLPQQLLWSRSNIPVFSPTGQYKTRMPSEKRSDRAPSWPWGCLDCPIVFNLLSGQQYEGSISVIEGNNPRQPILNIECEVLVRSSDEFAKDKSPKMNKDVRVTLDLDNDELTPEAGSVYYLLLARYIGEDSGSGDDPVELLCVSGIVVYSVVDGDREGFRRLGYFRWDVFRPVSQGFTFGGRMALRLV
ncbi:heterokaryon incompatibility protein-domain-containing protein [Cercophora samala]|uniref:Heterokaryon incompatibility protein-domain-containing protein n=1 Tax=Cercophora samala TaxID=330535 RepID=A0AA39Z1B9_9PEZI|nr:heterokaryon incompatibility protein-domain-containing protein [Cercophora samala]